MLQTLRRHGVRQVVLAAAASERRLEATLGDGSAYGVELEYCYETEPLGSGLAVKQAGARFDAPFFVCNGDVLSDLDLTDMAARHAEHKAIMSIFLAPVADPSSYGIADMDEAGRIRRFLEKPGPGQTTSRWANAGTWLFDPEVLAHIPDEKMDGSIERLVMPSLIAEGNLVLGYVADTYWMDVGTPERYLQVHRDLLGGAVPNWVNTLITSEPDIGPGCEIRADAEVGSQVVLGAGTRIGAQARIRGPSVIGDGTVVGDRAVVESSVVWPEVHVGAEAIVRNSIIGEACVIGSGCEINDSVLANGARVETGVRLSGARLEPDEVAG
jgi:mannose-1-phosphate guanylyltransferase